MAVVRYGPPLFPRDESREFRRKTEILIFGRLVTDLSRTAASLIFERSPTDLASVNHVGARRRKEEEIDNDWAE